MNAGRIMGMKLLGAALACWAIVACGSFAAAANYYHETFEDATALYEKGEYAEAAAELERIVAERVSNAAVFYNLGNAYYRQGRLGAAIANYERALRVEPGMEPARNNLEQAVSQTEQRLSRPESSAFEKFVLFWHGTLSPALVSRLAIAFWLGCWALLAIRLWRPAPFLRRGALICALLAGMFGLSAWVKAHPQELAVVRAGGAPVLYGTSADSTVRFELKEGDRAAVDRQRDGWARITVVDGNRGWTQTDNLIMVGPPFAPTPAPDEAEPGGETESEGN